MKDILLLGKKIIPDKSEILLSCLPDENWEKDFMRMGGEWHYENGWLSGSERGNCGGILFSRTHFECDVLFSFTMKSKLPATRDLNALFCAEWDYDSDYLKSAYICGLHGWYEHKAGIERFPENGLSALTTLYHYTPGTEVRITTGVVNGHTFMLVDGELVMELVLDPAPKGTGHIGFSPYCTSLLIKDIEVRKAFWEERAQSYVPEF